MMMPILITNSQLDGEIPKIMNLNPEYNKLLQKKAYKEYQQTRN